MKSDIEIAQSTVLRPINDIIGQLGIDPEKTEGYGKYIAKVDISAIQEEAVRKHHLILVTAISPTKAGIGKTTVSVGLALGMNAIGFWITSMVGMLAFFYTLKGEKKINFWVALLIAVALGSLCYFGMTKLFNIPMPKGTLWKAWGINMP